jgi:hypothetical protein
MPSKQGKGGGALVGVWSLNLKICAITITFLPNSRVWASSAVLRSRYVNSYPINIFRTSKFSYLVFFNLTLKTKTGTANVWRVLIAIHLDQSTTCVLLCCAFSCLSKLCKNARPKPLCWAKLACLDFSSFNFHLQSHILSTTEVALVNWKFTQSAHHPLHVCQHVWW